MSVEHRYFKITGGAVLAAWESFQAERLGQIEALRNLAREFGATQAACGCSRGVQAMEFEGAAPAGWIRNRKFDKGFKPDGRTAEGRKLLKRFKTYKVSDWWGFQAKVIGEHNPFYFMRGMHVSAMQVESIGNCHVLLVPFVPTPNQENGNSEEGAKWQPPDEHCQPLKHSEYWALKEAAAIPAQT